MCIELVVEALFIAIVPPERDQPATGRDKTVPEYRRFYVPS